VESSELGGDWIPDPDPDPENVIVGEPAGISAIAGKIGNIA